MATVIRFSRSPESHSPFGSVFFQKSERGFTVGLVAVGADVRCIGLHCFDGALAPVAQLSDQIVGMLPRDDNIVFTTENQKRQVGPLVRHPLGTVLVVDEPG